MAGTVLVIIAAVSRAESVASSDGVRRWTIGVELLNPTTLPPAIGSYKWLRVIEQYCGLMNVNWRPKRNHIFGPEVDGHGRPRDNNQPFPTNPHTMKPHIPYSCQKMSFIMEVSKVIRTQRNGWANNKACLDMMRLLRMDLWRRETYWLAIGCRALVDYKACLEHFHAIPRNDMTTQFNLPPFAYKHILDGGEGAEICLGGVDMSSNIILFRISTSHHCRRNLQWRSRHKWYRKSYIWFRRGGRWTDTLNQWEGTGRWFVRIFGLWCRWFLDRAQCVPNLPSIVQRVLR